MPPAPLRSTAVPADWRLVRQTLTVAGEHFALDVLPSFEEATAEMYPRLGGRADRQLREDLSPMFGTLWGSSRVLIAMAARASGLDGTTVLEMGCGLALPAMVAARRGARVVASDQHADAGPLLERNLQLNELLGRVAYRTFDWRDTTPMPRFRHVWASDVLFAHDMPALAAQAFARTLAPGGVGWLTDPGRAWLPEVVPAAEALGLEAAIDVGDDGEGTEAFVVTLRWR